MAPLGIWMTTIGALGGDHMAMGAKDTIVVDFFWEQLADCELTPIPIISPDNNDMWDLDGNNHYMPQLSPINEGFWEIDGNSDFQPNYNC
tara:strand:+ start:392 stop:661 length:270 start_codon:yes stop_codon:yes gene_type:complete